MNALRPSGCSCFYGLTVCMLIEEEKEKEQRVTQERPGQSLEDQIDAVRSYFERAAAAQEEKEGGDGKWLGGFGR